MFLKEISIKEYKALKDINIKYLQQSDKRTYPIASLNGGGKSTLLQFIFVMLHCPFNKKRNVAVKNLLRKVSLKNRDVFKELASFKLLFDGQDVDISYFLCDSKNQKYDFDAILDLEELIAKKGTIKDTKSEVIKLNNLKDDITSRGRMNSLMRRELEKYVRNKMEDDIISRGNTSDVVNWLEQKIIELSNEMISEKELAILIESGNQRLEELNNLLLEEGLSYALHLTDYVLLYKSNVDQIVLEKLSNKVFLTAPKTQVFQFLSEDINDKLFSNKDSYYLYRSYDTYLKEAQNSLNGLFTYEFASNELIMDCYKKARDADFEQAIETGEYGDNFSKLKKELGNFLTGKEITIDKTLSEVVFKTGKTKNLLSPSDLSHGELKKLSIFIWLKLNASKDSLILMDEIDIGLHPTWQYDIGRDLQRWTHQNQFILATHSPQIISCSHYQNLVVLVRDNTTNKSMAKQYNEAYLDADLNTIIKTIMGANYLPKELVDLHKKYRKFVENGTLDAKEAKELKEKILEYESEGSSFFQEMKFLSKFKG